MAVDQGGSGSCCKARPRGVQFSITVSSVAVSKWKNRHKYPRSPRERLEDVGMQRR